MDTGTTTTTTTRDNEKRLNFGSIFEQYKEALKEVSSSVDPNQLLKGLIDVCSKKQEQNVPTHSDKSQAQQTTYESASTSSSTVSSCRSSILRLSSNGSSSNQSLMDTSGQQQLASISSSHPDLMQRLDTTFDDLLRPVFIDGSNVARAHGKDVNFSWQGIRFCVDWFQKRNHKVKVLIPEDKCQGVTSKDEEVIEYLNQIGALIKTPIGHNDDLFIIEAARQMNGVIVSNDLYRDEKRRLASDDFDRFVYFNRLPYIFVDDLFIPANDPRGRSGPRLDEFLRRPPLGCDQSVSLYGHNDKFYRTRGRRLGGTSQYQANSRQQSEYNHYLYLKNRPRTLPAEQIRRPPPQEQVQSPTLGSLISIGRTNYNRIRDGATQVNSHHQRST